MALVLSGSIDISGSMTATTILISTPGAAGMVSSSAQIRELAPLMAYTASLKGAAIVSSSQQVQNYNLFAQTSSANTFYGNQTVVGSITARSGVFTAPNNVVGTLLIQGGKEEGGFGETNSRLDFGSNDPSVAENDGLKIGGRISSVIENANGAHVGMRFSTYQQGRTPDLREEVVITYTGDLKLNNGNLVIGTAGKGIDFSATSNGSGTTTSELLNDYEEGTWTPIIGGETSQSGQSYSGQSGHYTKVGRIVTVTFRAVLTNKGTITGSAAIKGLPFTIDASGNSYGAGVTYFDGLATSWSSIFLNVEGGTTFALIDGIKTAAALSTRATTSDIGNSTQFNGSFTYFV